MTDKIEKLDGDIAALRSRMSLGLFARMNLSKSQGGEDAQEMSVSSPEMGAREYAQLSILFCLLFSLVLGGGIHLTSSRALLDQAHLDVGANQTTCLSAGGTVLPARGATWYCRAAGGEVHTISKLTQLEADARLAHLVK